MAEREYQKETLHRITSELLETCHGASSSLNKNSTQGTADGARLDEARTLFLPTRAPPVVSLPDQSGESRYRRAHRSALDAESAGTIKLGTRKGAKGASRALKSICGQAPLISSPCRRSLRKNPAAGSRETLTAPSTRYLSRFVCFPDFVPKEECGL